MEKKEQYLYQCWAAIHQNQTLALDFMLSAPTDKDDTPALMLHNKFSRFVLGFIDNSSTVRKIMKANIRAEEVPYLLQQYELAVSEKFRRKNVPEENGGATGLSIAYTVQLRAGQYKGKTPAEILLEDKNKAAELTRHRDWLSSYLSTYPKNQEVMDAIDDALYLLSSNELIAPSSLPAGTRSMVVFQEDYKIMSNGSEDSKTCAKIAITCEYENNNPWCVRIENSEHPIENGELNRRVAIDRRCGSIYLNDAEMANFMSTIRNLKLLFENYNFAAAFQFVESKRWRPE